MSQSADLSWARRQEIKRQQNVKRCLFGRPDAGQLSADLQRQEILLNQAEVERFREKWSYDPETGDFLSEPYQDYEFILVDKLSDVPSFYTRGYGAKNKSEPAPLLGDCVCYIGIPRRQSAVARRRLDLGQGRVDRSQDEVDANRCSRHGSAESDRSDDSHDLASRRPGLVVAGDSAVVTEDEVVSDGHSRVSPCVHTSEGLSESTDVPSPASRLQEFMTPPRRCKQQPITDFIPIKKQRKMTKSLPRA